MKLSQTKWNKIKSILNSIELNQFFCNIIKEFIKVN